MPDTTYTVRSGDSLWRIADRQGVDFEALKAANPALADRIPPYGIDPGETIALPDTGIPPTGAQSLPVVEEGGYSPAPWAEEDTEPSQLMEHDVPFGETCTQCSSMSPCSCVLSLSVEDKEDGSRKVEWPAPPSDPSTLLIVADKTSFLDCHGEVTVKRQDSGCTYGSSDPHTVTTGSLDTKEGAISRTAAVFDEKVGAPVLPLATTASRLLPDAALKYVAIFDLVANVVSFARMIRSPATFRTNHCIYSLAHPSLDVIAVPQLEVVGTGTASVTLVISTAGANGYASLEGSLSGKFGPNELKAEGALSTGNIQGAAPTTRPGILGTLESVLGHLNSIASQTGTSLPTSRDLRSSDFATSITIDHRLELNFNALKLKPKSGTPDLQLEAKGIEFGVSLSVGGRLNILEVIASRFGLGRALTEAQAALANGENIAVEIKTELNLSSAGKVVTGLDFGTVDILHTGEVDTGGADIAGSVSGYLRVIASGELMIKVEAVVWIFKAEAGAQGSVSTAWRWQFRKKDGKRQGRSYFEGLYLAGEAHFKVEVKDSKEVKSDGGGRWGRTSTQQTLAGGQAGTALDASALGEALQNQLYGKEGTYTLFEPTVVRVTDTEPPWHDH